MSNKIFLGMLALIVILGGYVIYTNNNSNGVEEKMGNQVSFNCAEGDSFIAEFSFDMTKLNVVIGGEVKYTLNNTGDESVPYRFGDSERQYTFAGEEVTVSDINSGTDTVCTQPLDSNNAPYNFGDEGEGDGSQQDLSTTVGENILGVWKSVDDQKFTRTFQSDGTFIDSYEGRADTKGDWIVFMDNSGLVTNFALEPNTVYLRLLVDSPTNETLHFKVSKVTPEELELIYMERGGTLLFTAVKQ